MLMFSRKDRLPIINRIVVPDILDVDEIRMLTSPEPEKSIRLFPLHVYRKWNALKWPLLVEVPVDKTVFLLKSVMHSRTKCFCSAAKPKLVKS